MAPDMAASREGGIRIPYVMVDAFTDRAFEGNPAAVCLVQPGADPGWMQLVAAEFNVSQTAFLARNKQAEEDGYDYELRWFTPTKEVPLCGHATLASAYYLFTEGMVESDLVRFQTKSGVLPARRIKGKSPTNFQMELNFPMATSTSFGQWNMPVTFGNTVVVSVSKTQLGDLLVELPSREDVEGLQPNMDEILVSCERGLIVTAQASDDSEFDFVSRFFCPKLGLNEDPVCGTAHCGLAPYWAKKLEKNSLYAYQVSKRGGKLGLEVQWEHQRVLIRGEAVITMSGFLSAASCNSM